jgi:hypothetical protein
VEPAEDAPGFDELPLSPELVLVDPELARWARARLPDPKDVTAPPGRLRPVAVPDTVVSLPLPLPAPVPEVRRQSIESLPLPAARRGSRVLHGASLLLALALGVFVGSKLFDGSTKNGAGPAPLRTQPPQTPTRGATNPTGSAPRVAKTPSAGPRTKKQSSVKRRPPKAKKQSGVKRRPPKAKKPVPSIGSPGDVRVFSWAPTPTAAYYRFSLYRSGERIFSARSRAARLELPATWTHHGRRLRLRMGRYRWVIRPALRDGGRLRLGPPVVSAALVIGR